MKALVLGGGGFIGDFLVKDLVQRGFQVRAVDLQSPAFGPSSASEFILGDLRDPQFTKEVFSSGFDEVYQLAANMGGAQYIFTGANDAHIMHDSALINLNCVEAAHQSGARKMFFSSSACVYPEFNQRDLKSLSCSEDSAIPAAPDSDYGWEKLFSERLYLSYLRNKALNVKIARLHNVYGEHSTWRGGREKAPAAICRKVAQARNGDEIEIWGDGKQTRSFLYIQDCLRGIRLLMDSPYSGPFNIGSEEMVSIEELTRRAIAVSGKNLKIRYTPGPVGVRCRNSDNRLVTEKLGWEPNISLSMGIERLYCWIENQVRREQIG